MEEIRIRKPPTTPASKLAQSVVSNSAAASGLLTGTDDGCRNKSAWYPVQCAAAPPTPYQGWVLRAGAPALSGVFLPLFFLRRRRKNGAPGGRQQACLEEIRIRKPPTTPASKLARCVVSASAAASGKLTRPDDGCSHKPAWHPVQCAAAPPTPTQGGGYVGRGTPRPARRLSFHILSSPVKKEYGPRRALALSHRRN